MLMRRGDKKGLSPVIASVLLIALVLVLAAIVFLWARGFISEQIEKFGQPINDICEDVAFDVDLFNGSNGREIEVVNRGNVNIQRLDIKKIAGANSEIEGFEIPVPIGQSATKEITLEMDNGDEVEKIKIYPAIVGNVKGKATTKVYTCLENGKTITL